MSKYIPLNDNWFFSKGFEPSYLNNFPSQQLVFIPHTVKTLPYNNFCEEIYQMLCSYQKTFSIKKQKKKRYILHFKGVMGYCEVYVNKKMTISHKSGFTPFKVDITNNIKDGENTIVVMVDTFEQFVDQPTYFMKDYLLFGGIYREVYLEETIKNFVSHALAFVKEDHLNIRLLLNIKQPKSTVFHFNVYTKNQLVYYFDREYDLIQSEILVKERMYLEPWTLDNPILYDLEIRTDEDILYRTRFANRQIEFKKDGFYLNEQRVQLIGLNRHQAFPYVGYAMPASAQRKDADILKYQLGVNIVRTTCFPPSRHFLDRCDEIGLLVFNELAIIPNKINKSWKKVFKEDLTTMIIQDYNHPSVIIRGLRVKEIVKDDLYQEIKTTLKSLDQTRPLGLLQFVGSFQVEETYIYNDLLLSKNHQQLSLTKQTTKKDIINLIAENNKYIFPTKRFDNETYRIKNVVRHLNTLEATLADKQKTGAILWHMVDYNTHKEFGSGDNICYCGVMDMFRYAKDASYVYASQSLLKPVMHVTSNMHLGDLPEGKSKQVIVLTNVDYLKLYLNDEILGIFRPNREQYPSLPHPPIIIDDFIGNLIHNHESFSQKDANKVKHILRYTMNNGHKLPFNLKSKMAWIRLKYKIINNDFLKLYEKHVLKQGQKSLTYRFEGYQNKILVVSKIFSASSESHIEIMTDETEIIEKDTYEVSRVVITVYDEHQNVRVYASDALTLNAYGSIEIIGPKIVSFVGGVIVFWVKSRRIKGLGKLVISSKRYGEYIVSYNVK